MEKFADVIKSLLAWLLVALVIVGTMWVIWVYLPDYCSREHQSWLTECRER